jgi:hypothetical protein
MKLDKEQKQKIALGAMLLVGVVYGFIEFLISPVSTAREAAVTNTNALEPKIQMARAQIAKTEGLKAKLPDADKLIAQVSAMIPDGAPVAWFPPRVTEYFRRQGIDKVSARLNSEVVEKELTGYKRINWGVEFPRVDFIAFARAVSEMENGEPLLEIQGVELEVSRDEVSFERGNLNVNNLVRLQ